MIPPPSPVTTEAARLWLLAHQFRDPSRVALEHLPHPDFEADPVAGGVAFVLTRRYGTTLVHVLADGGYGYRQDPGDEAGRRAAIDDLWTHQRVRTGTLRPSEPHPCDRAARTVLERGVTWVADLPVADRPGVGPAELPDAERRRLVLRAGRDVAWRGIRPALPPRSPRTSTCWSCTSTRSPAQLVLDRRTRDLDELLDPSWPARTRVATIPSYDDSVGRDLPML